MHSETSNCRFAAKPGMCDLRSFLRDQSFFIALGEEGEGGGDLEDSGLCYHKMYLITVKALQFLISLPRSLAVNL